MAIEIALGGKVALVTGATGGVGAAVCEALDRAGARLVMCDLVQDHLEELRRRLPGREGHMAFAADLAMPERCHALIDAALEHCERVDILVNVAAVLRRIPILELSLEEYERTFDINLRSQFLLCQRVLPHMTRRGSGAIVNFTSPSAFTGGKVDATHYAASKAGVVALSRGLATQFGGRGVRTNVLCPGTTDTPMIRDTLTDDQVRMHAQAIPIGRLARPAEIANGVVFLASDLASFVNGAVLTIDGGGSLRP